MAAKRPGLTQALGRMSDNPYSAPRAELVSPGNQHGQEMRPRYRTRILFALAGLLLGVVSGPFVGYALVMWSNDCKPGPGEPCDGIPLLVMGSALVLAATLGVFFSAIGYWLARRRDIRRAA